MASRGIWSAVQYDQRCNMASSAIWPVVEYGQLYDMTRGVTRGIWPAVQYGQPCNMGGRGSPSLARHRLDIGIADVGSRACLSTEELE